MLILNTLHQLDCIQSMRPTDEGSVDLVFADPRFKIRFESDIDHDRKDAESYLNGTDFRRGSTCSVSIKDVAAPGDSVAENRDTIDCPRCGPRSISQGSTDGVNVVRDMRSDYRTHRS